MQHDNTDPHQQDPHLPESTPGVYVRADKEGELPQELDVLWSGGKPNVREDRSPVIPFVLGSLLGVALASAVFFLFIIKPDISDVDTSEMMLPVTESTIDENFNTVPEESVNKNTSTGKKTVMPLRGESTGQAQVRTGSSGPIQSRRYVVRNGDTLSVIAQNVYGSSAPKYIQKIQRANNITNPNRLKLNQELIIPPSRY
ncbi:MAG: LysM peptidoglycan-binding domain-containing protein [Cyanobacteria bacterium P01_H01_bin.74]